MIFAEAPADFQKEIDVVGCYVMHDDKLVLLQRQPHKSNGEKLGLPAGKVDAGETIVQAMCREIHEETGLVVSADQLTFIGSVCVRNEGHDLGYHMFITTFSEQPNIVINPKEHQRFIWATPQEALTLNLIHYLDECIKSYFQIA